MSRHTLPSMAAPDETVLNTQARLKKIQTVKFYIGPGQFYCLLVEHILMVQKVNSMTCKINKL